MCFTWTKPHPEDSAPSRRVWAIYPRKKDALADTRFRGESYVIEINIKIRE